MSLSADEIASVIAELSPRWTGAQIQKVHMDGPRTLKMKLRVPGESGVLRLSIEARGAHLCVVDARGSADEVASAFCMVLRKHLGGGRLLRIERIGDDRIVSLRGSRAELIVEMTGRRARFVLCDESRRVIAVSSTDLSRTGLARGSLWAAPPAGGRSPRPPRFTEGSVNDAIAQAYAKLGEVAEVVGRRDILAGRLRKRLKKQRRLVSKIESDIDRGGDPLVWQRWGELLKANLHRVERGATALTVDDWYDDGATVEIALNPTLGPSQNLEQLFTRARKARRGREISHDRLAAAQKEAERLERQLGSVADLDEDDLASLASLETSLGGLTSPRLRKKKQTARRPHKTFLDLRGQKILVGRSAADNDRLTVQIAKPNDLWLHARDVHGSHVVLPLARNEDIDAERLLDAATLAAHFSEARGNGAVEVRYTRRRYVQKPRGAPPGTVLLLREKVLNLRVEADRLERILSTRLDS